MNTAAESPLPPAVARFAVLSVRRGISLGVLLSNHRRDFELLLAAAAQRFKSDRGYSEREVNDLLRAFLAGAGAMLGTDHVELRRWLVDFRVLDRDGFGRVYTTGTCAPAIADFIAQLEGVDLAAVARAKREDDATRRAQRKTRWQSVTGTRSAT